MDDFHTTRYPVLVIRDLTVDYGRLRALDGLSLEVLEGEILGIIGPNGAGKSTLIGAICGSVRPKAGVIVLRGRDITRLPSYARCHLGIGRTYQIPQPFENLTVLENVMVGAIYGAGFDERRGLERANELLDLTGLYDRRNALAGHLGLLDRKRLELARALATDPELLLLDEVAGGLTEPETRLLLELLQAVRGPSLSIMWVEHNLVTIREGADRVLCMAGGRTIALGSPSEVMTNREVQSLYLGELATIEGNPAES